MFNLLVKSSPWAEGRDKFWKSRVFEYTLPAIKAAHSQSGTPNFPQLCHYPALFVEETIRGEPQFGRAGRVNRVVEAGGDDMMLEISFDPQIPPIPQVDLIGMASLLGVDAHRSFGMFSRVHWALKDIDLYHVLMAQQFDKRRFPKAFELKPLQQVNPSLLSAMMPFAGFDAVWAAIQQVAQQNGMIAKRADNVWEHHEIIQDIVALIDEAAIIICDCTGRNANVFYEIGIAHALGKDIILITQSANDIPFDLSHHRYLPYLNNSEGMEKLKTDLSTRIGTLCRAQNR